MENLNDRYSNRFKFFRSLFTEDSSLENRQALRFDGRFKLDQPSRRIFDLTKSKVKSSSRPSTRKKFEKGLQEVLAKKSTKKSTIFQNNLRICNITT